LNNASYKLFDQVSEILLEQGGDITVFLRSPLQHRLTRNLIYAEYLPECNQDSSFQRFAIAIISQIPLKQQIVAFHRAVMADQTWLIQMMLDKLSELEKDVSANFILYLHHIVVRTVQIQSDSTLRVFLSHFPLLVPQSDASLLGPILATADGFPPLRALLDAIVVKGVEAAFSEVSVPEPAHLSSKGPGFAFAFPFSNEASSHPAQSSSAGPGFRFIF